MKNKKQTEQEKVSEHFRELGKKSWESRKKAILARVKEDKKLST